MLSQPSFEVDTKMRKRQKNHITIYVDDRWYVAFWHSLYQDYVINFERSFRSSRAASAAVRKGIFDQVSYQFQLGDMYA